MKKTIASLTLCLALLLTSAPAAFAAGESTLPFKDVDPESYYYEAVEWAYRNNVTSGVSETEFSLDTICTRAQVMTFLWRAKGCPEPASRNNPFEDVTEKDYFYLPVLWAVEQGIAKGTSTTTFSPHETCTYAHILTFLWRAVGGPDAAPTGLTEGLPDDCWYKQPLSWAHTNGLLGDVVGGVQADDPCSRGDTVDFLFHSVADKADEADVYAPILEEYREFIRNGFDENKDYSYVSSGIMEMAGWMEPEQLSRSVGYAVMDLNGDGISELLIGTIPQENAAVEEKGVIFSGYSCKDGKAVCFLDGWARSSYRWMGGGNFYYFGSGGAMYSIFAAYKLAPDGTDLAAIDYYFTYQKDESFQEIGFYHNTTGEWDQEVSEELDISEEEFWELMNSYEKQCVQPELTPFSE